jgi:hypothetical protein
MSIIRRLVKNGKVELESPLPEGTQVECRPLELHDDLPQEFWDDLRAYQQASADALAKVEQLAEEMQSHEPIVVA